MPKGRRRKKRKEADIDGWLNKYGEELAQFIGLDFLGLSKDEIRKVLRKPLEAVYGSPSSRPTAETIAKRFRRYSDNINPLIAVGILEARKELTRDQLEYVVNNIGRAILAFAHRIYMEIVRKNAKDLLPLVRRLWANYWIRLKSKTLPAECPYCGFNSLMPDLTCLVCGKVSSEKMVKKSIKLDSYLKEIMKHLTNDELKELYLKGYVLVNGLGIKLPGELREKVDIEIHLSEVEKSIIKEEMKRRGISC